MSRSIAADKVLEYLGDHQDMPSKTLARLLRKDHPKVFHSIDYARGAIRRYTGRSGKENRQSIKERRFYLPTPTPENPYSLPDSWAEPWLPYVVGPQYKRILVLADIHVPFHDEPAVNVAIKEGKKFKPDMLILNGDIWDCYALSRFIKDPDLRDFPAELEAIRQTLMVLRKQFPDAKIIYKEGNHEERFGKLLIQQAPDFFGVEEFRIEVLLGLFDLGIDWITDKRYIAVGKLNILHGAEWGGGTGTVSPARTAFLKLKECALTAHNHQVSQHAEPTLRGKLVSTWSVGCLSELHPQYMPINRWSHGYATIYTYGTDDFKVENYRIVKGVVV